MGRPWRAGVTVASVGLSTGGRKDSHRQALPSGWNWETWFII